jgi:hypothetical protein
MLRNNNGPTASNTGSTPPARDFSANHEREKALERLKELEMESRKIMEFLEESIIEDEKYTKKELIEITQNVNSSTTKENLEEYKTKIIEDLSIRENSHLANLVYLGKKANEMMDSARKVVIPKVDPSEILKYIKSSKSYNDMNSSEQMTFKELELALNDTSIIKANPSEVNRYSLGILGVVFDAGLISSTLFNNLSFTRIDQLSDSFKWEEVNGGLYSLSSLEMCRLVDKDLSSDGDEDYQNSKEQFKKRLNAIFPKDIKKNYKEILQMDLSKLPNSTCNLNEKEMKKLSEVEIPILQPDPIETHEMQVNPTINLPIKKNTLYSVDNQFEKNLLRFVPEHKKHQVEIGGILGCKFSKLMQATLSTVEASSDKEKDGASRCYMAEATHILNEGNYKFQERARFSNENYKDLRDEVARKFKKIDIDFENKIKKIADCHLEGEELLTAYIKKIQRNCDFSLDQLNKEEKYKIKELKTFQSSSEIKKEYGEKKETVNSFLAKVNKMGARFLENKDMILHNPSKEMRAIEDMDKIYQASPSQKNSANEILHKRPQEFKNKIKEIGLELGLASSSSASLFSKARDKFQERKEYSEHGETSASVNRWGGI